MLELHDCIYCGQPVIVNTKLNLVYSIQCDHDNDALFYIPVTMGGVNVGVPTEAVHHSTATTPVKVVPYAAMWVGDGDEEDE